MIAATYHKDAPNRTVRTLARFDAAHDCAFKSILHRLPGYPALWCCGAVALRAFHAVPGGAQAVDFDICKRGCFSPSQVRSLLGIVPADPIPDRNAPDDLALELSARAASHGQNGADPL